MKGNLRYVNAVPSESAPTLPSVLNDLNDVKVSIIMNHDTPLLIKFAIIEIINERGYSTIHSVVRAWRYWFEQQN
jgi:hypothetical protein